MRQYEKADMTMNTVTIEKRTHDFRAIRQNEPGWLYEQRRSGWEFYNDSPLPDRITHLWRYTKPERFLIGQPDETMIRPVPAHTGKNGISSAISGGYAAYGMSRADLSVGIVVADKYAQSGARITDLHSAISSNADAVQQRLGKLVGERFGKFEAANLALWNAGFFVYIPDNTEISEPIYLSHNPLDDVFMSRSLVIIGRNSQVTIIDDFGSDSARPCPLTNSVTEIFAGESSQVRYVSLSRLHEKTPAIFTERVRADRNAHIVSVFGSFGGSVTKLNAGAVLAGTGAESLMYGLAFGDGRQHLDHHTLHHHVAGNTRSNLHVKVVLKDNSDSAYTGLIRIEEKADNSQAYQENRNLLLNEGARAESIPELEILTDQVSCTHGATVGPIDPEMVFYLKSRGYSNEEATRTVVSGFVEPTIRLMPDNLQDLLRGLVHRKLEGSGNGN